MKPEELRFGNYVMWPEDKGINIVEWGFGHWLGIHHKNYRFPDPVPLSKDWFLALGFKPIGNDWAKKGVIIHTRKRGYSFRKSVPDIKHVHELQNLFFALTGEELTR